MGCVPDVLGAGGEGRGTRVKPVQFDFLRDPDLNYCFVWEKKALDNVEIQIKTLSPIHSAPSLSCLRDNGTVERLRLEQML